MLALFALGFVAALADLYFQSSTTGKLAQTLLSLAFALFVAGLLITRKKRR